jgi:predicted nucleic acid-binding protein
MTHLDTSFLIDLLREQRRGAFGPAHTALEVMADDPLGVSVFALSELEVGVLSGAQSDRERAAVRTLADALTVAYPDSRFPQAYAEALLSMSKGARALATMDVLIGVTALVEGASLLTRNTRHFKAIPGLVLLSY